MLLARAAFFRRAIDAGAKRKVFNRLRSLKLRVRLSRSLLLAHLAKDLNLELSETGKALQGSFSIKHPDSFLVGRQQHSKAHIII